MTAELKCRFCSLVFPALKNKKPAWKALAAHVADKHEKEHRSIETFSRSKKEPENLARHDCRSRGKASLGREFRRRMGENQNTPGAENKAGKEG